MVNPNTRWQSFYQDDQSLVQIPHSQAAQFAVECFLQSNKQFILDLGCGAGRDSTYLAERALKVIGLDAARSGLTLAQNRKIKVDLFLKYIEGDARNLPIATNSIEGVFCFGLLHEFVSESSKEIVKCVMEEIYRVLQKNGILILAVLAGEPDKGLPQVQLFTEDMFDEATSGLKRIVKKTYKDLGCTGKTDYRVWYGQFEKI